MRLSILHPGLRRKLLVRTLATGLLPVIVLAFVCAQVTDRIATDRFEADGVARAQAVTTRLKDRVAATTQAARMVAEIQPTRDALATSDVRDDLRLLIPLKTRLGLDVLNLADADGHIRGAAQDNGDYQTIRPELTGPFLLRAEQSWIIDAQPDGRLLLRTAAPVRNAGEMVGIVEAGAQLGAEFLQPLAGLDDATSGSAAALVGLFWDGQPRAMTSDTLAAVEVPRVEELRASPSGRIVRHVSAADASYLGVFSVRESHQATPLVLAVLIPLAPVESARALVALILLALVGGLSIAVAVTSYRFSGAFLRPLADLANAARRLESGDLQVHIASSSPHELGQLESAFGTMAESLRAREQVLSGLVEQLEVRALTDELTGLPNRTALLERLNGVLDVRRAAEDDVALLLLDLDRFKEVNDTLGHQAGDAVLQETARRFRAALKTSDTVARLGGDEFAVLLPGTSMADGVVVAQKLLRSLEFPVLFGGRPLDIGASIGIASRIARQDDGAALLRRADVAMYAAKRGRTRWACYSPEQDDQNPERLALLGELRKAIHDNQLVLYFQPTVGLEEGRVVHAEALVRWQHPERGLIAPDAFIPIAEQTGLIAPLTEWVLDAALRQARIWRSRGLPMPVAVNISVQSLQDPRFAHTVSEMLSTHHVPAGDLIIEVTETSVIRDPARATELLSQLRALGVRIAIDDFGAGQSALGYLKQLPADELKIDRSFVRELPRSERDAAIVGAAIDLAHRLGLQVVAEGVEDQATWDELRSLGCDIAQGYYMARPLPPQELDKWMDSSAWGIRAQELPEAA